MSYLQLAGITKRFGDFTALDDVCLSVQQGSIHALLGENGAGKTTLMNILYGFYRADHGTLQLAGKPLNVASPRQALDAGVGMIHQHFMLVDNLSVLENVILGLPGGLSLKLAMHRRRLLELCERVGFAIDPDAVIAHLPIGTRQQVEILKALYRDVDLLILDEPSSVLGPGEIDAFLRMLQRLRAMGKTMLFITHKLDEVFQVCDRVTVMRQGRVVGNVEIADTTPAEVSRLMVGRELAPPPQRVGAAPGKQVLQLERLSAMNDRGIQALHQISLDIRAGEVLGIAGVDGNGQAELAECIAGLRTPNDGDIRVCGNSVLAHDVATRRTRDRIGFVPEDRHSTGLILDFTLWENAMLRDSRQAPFSARGLLRRAAAYGRTEQWCTRYDVRMHSIQQKIRFLSGGNQQKLIFAREVECDPNLLVVMQPCKGLDVGAIEALQRTVLEQRAKGKAVLYISTELDEVLAVSDRIGVMCAGYLTGVLERTEATVERIALLMTSTAPKEVAL